MLFIYAVKKLVSQYLTNDFVVELNPESAAELKAMSKNCHTKDHRIFYRSFDLNQF